MNSALYPSSLPDNCFRLMEWLDEPSRPSPNLRFNLVDVPFVGYPQYNALSYRWQDFDPNFPETKIQCNGLEIGIGANLYHALRELSTWPKRLNYIWVDCICIEQSNLEEKQRQILMMAQIYRNAEQVVIWLGESDAQTDQAADILLLLIGLMNDIDKSLQPDSPKPLDESQTQLRDALFQAVNHAPSPIAQEMHKFLSRSWFSRSWTLQESAIASSSAIVKFGSKEFPYSHLLHLADRYVNDTAGHWVKLVSGIRPLASTTDAERPNLPILLHMKAVLKMREALERMSSTRSSARPVIKVLNYLRPLECGEPQDRIFCATAFLPPELITTLRKDGRVSTKKLYENLATLELATYQNIHCLAAAGLSQHRIMYPQRYSIDPHYPLLQLPSWVPDWTHRKRHEPLWVLNDDLQEVRGFNLYETTRGTTPTITVRTSTDDTKIMTVKGIVLDLIIEHGKPFVTHTLPADFDADQHQEILLDFYVKFKDQLEQYISLASRHFRPTAVSPGEAAEKLTTIRRTLIGNMVPEVVTVTMAGTWTKARTEQIDPIFEELDDFAQELEQICSDKRIVSEREKKKEEEKKEAVSAQQPQQEQQQQKEQKEQVKNAEMPSTTLTPATEKEKEFIRTTTPPATITSTTTKPDTPNDSPPKIHPILPITTMCKGRTFFVTSDGRMGVGPDLLADGDRVCVFYGGCTPFVIRMVDDQKEETNAAGDCEERYQLIGECYVHGLMDGEVMEMQGLREQDICLV